MGFFHRLHSNWWGNVIILPLSFFLLSWLVKKMFSDPSKEKPSNVPILNSIEGESNYKIANDYLEKVVFHHRTLIIAFSLSLVLNIVDFWSSPGQYYWQYWCKKESIEAIRMSTPAQELDWSYYFLIKEGQYRVSSVLNFVFNIVVYSQQIISSLCGFLIMVIFAFYNYSFLSMIYQRRWSASQHKQIVVKLRDYSDNCFGFKDTRQIFNIQVIITAIIGCIMLTSRFANVPVIQSKIIGEIFTSIMKFDLKALLKLDYGEFQFHLLYPDAGQYILPIAWLILFGIVFMPALIKILPAIPKPFMHLSLLSFLKEFMPPGKWEQGCWEFGDNPTTEQQKIIVNEVAKEFSKNSFWPNGDHRAKVFFFIAIYIFVVLLFPIKFENGHMREVILFYVLSVGSFSATATAFIFYGVKYFLWFVSPHLISHK